MHTNRFFTGVFAALAMMLMVAFGSTGASQAQGLPVGEFELLNPSNGRVFDNISTFGEIRWTRSDNATEYRFGLDRTDVAVHVLALDLPAADICDADFCTIPVTDAVRSLLVNGEYEWRVRATDGTVQRNASNNPFTFTVDSTPAPFELLAPADGITVTDLQAFTEIQWTEATNAEEYRFALESASVASHFLTLIIPAADICADGICTIVVTDDIRAALVDDDYEWSVRAINSQGSTGASNNPFTFTVDTGTAAPGEFALIFPPDDIVVTDVSIVTEIRWEAADGADDYNFVLDRTSGSTNVLDLTLPAGDICGADECVIPVDDAVRALLINGDYSWTVDASNSDGTTGASNNPFTFSVEAAPRGFELVAPANGVTVTDTSLVTEIVWTVAQDAGEYNFVLDRTSDSTNVLDLTLPAGDICGASECVIPVDDAVRSLLIDGDYSWTVDAINSFGSTGADNNPFTFTVATPAAPGEFALIFPPDDIVVTDVSIVTEIRWEAADGADDYNFVLDRTSGSTNVLDLTLPAGDICGADECVIPVDDAVRALLINGDYSWTVDASNSDGTTGASNNPFTFSVEAAPRGFELVAPANGANVTDTSLVTEIVWTVAQDATDYNFVLDRTSDSTNVLDLTLSAVSICGASECVIPVDDTVRALLTDGDYSWTVDAINSFGTTGASNNPFTFTVATAPPAPTGLAVNGDLTTAPVLPAYGWDANGASWYRVVIGSADGSAIFFDQWLGSATACAGSCAFTPDMSAYPYGMFSGEYAFWVQAWDGSFSDFSEAMPFTVAVPQPALSGLSANAAQGQITISWQDDPNGMWTQLYVGNAQATLMAEWIQETSAICNGGTCTITMTANQAGAFDVWALGWGPGGFSAGGQSGWQGPVSLSIAPTQVPTNLSAAGNALSWTADGSATYYQVWAGQNGATAMFDWFEADALGCAAGGTCTLVDNLPAGSYDWYILAWGPTGFSADWVQGPAFTR